MFRCSFKSRPSCGCGSCLLFRCSATLILSWVTSPPSFASRFSRSFPLSQCTPRYENRIGFHSQFQACAYSCHFACAHSGAFIQQTPANADAPGKRADHRPHGTMGRILPLHGHHHRDDAKEFLALLWLSRLQGETSRLTFPSPFPNTMPGGPDINSSQS